MIPKSAAQMFGIHGALCGILSGSAISGVDHPHGLPALHVRSDAMPPLEESQFGFKHFQARHGKAGFAGDA